MDRYRESGLADTEKVGGATREVADFFETRCESFLKERGIVYDVVDAVARVSWARPGTALARSKEIARLRGDRLFERLITGVKRVGNIISQDNRLFGADWSTIQSAFGAATQETVPPESLRYSAGLFEEAAETQLLEAVRSAVPEIVKLDQQGNFNGVLAKLSSLADPIDFYFDKVLVNCENPETRENRHRFLAAVFSVFSKYADFSYIVEKDDA
jgi:glycyl-tRNA synthetase beta chain